MALYALFAVPARALFLALPGVGARVVVPIAGAVAALAVLLLWRWRRWLAARLAAAAARTGAAPRRWLLVAVVVGLALRVVWMAAMPAPFRSDGLAYAGLAEQLAAGEAYATGSGDRAHWPPGYPFFLAPLVALLGGARLAVLAANAGLFALLLPLAWLLGRRTLGEGPAALACLVLAVWPNLVTLAGVPSKELLLAVLVPGALALVLAAERAERTAGALAIALAAGAALGAAALTQPGTVLLVLPLAAHVMGSARSRRTAAAGVAGLLLGLLAGVLPWMWRNQRVLGAPILASAGGSVFYRANNERATGEHLPEKGLPLAVLPEVERSRRGFALGRAWIADNPGAFGRLALRKLVVFLGDDSGGIYHTLRERWGPGPGYALAKAVVLAFWWLLWAGVLLGSWVHGRVLAASPGLLLFQLALLYFVAVDAVFEAGGRHHVPLAALVALLAVSAAARLPLERADAAVRC